MFTPQEILDLKIYCQSVTGRPRTLDEQPCEKKDGHFFLDDWEIIEILKYFFNGESYWPDPVPNRLKGNLLWKGKDDIKDKAERLLKDCGTVNNIIEQFKKRREIK